jgi:outer membrane protein assembly factor BamB
MDAAGVVYGHAHSAPPAFDLDGNRQLEIFFTSEGLPRAHGGIRAVRADGSDMFRTQSANPAARWYLGPWDVDFANGDAVTEAEARLQAPVVPMRRYRRRDLAVVAAADTGQIYAWDQYGVPLPGFQPKRNPGPGAMAVTDMVSGRTFRESISGPIATADLYGDGHSQILVASGSPYNYSYDGFNNGAVYCYSDQGERLWRYPATGALPGFGSGVSVGRAAAGCAEPVIVAADSEGKVHVLDRADGRLIWSYQIERYPGRPYPANLARHPYYRAVSTQPLIADINDDGVQDVVVGTVDGEVYALSQTPGTREGHVLPGFPLRGFRGPQTTWQGATETHDEEVSGIALAPLDPTTPDHAFLLVTTGRAAVSNPNPIGGHALLFDLGADSWNARAADWPQYQQNAQKLGQYPGS